MAGGADKIKLFKFIQKTYQNYGGISPPQSNQNHSPINSKNWFILFSLAQLFISTAAFLLFEANSAIEYAMVFYTCTSMTFYSILYLTSIWQMKNFLSYIENCEQFIEKRTHSTIVYKETNEKIERLTKFSTYAIIVSSTFLMMPALLYAVVSYYVLDSGKESFILFFLTWLPFDWKTPLGYLVAWIAQCSGAAAATITFMPFFNIIFGSCWLFIVMAKDIKSDVVAFNTTVETQKDRSEHVKIMECFGNMIQHYLDAKKLLNDFNEIYEYSLLAFFSWNLLAISSLLMSLQFQLWDDESKLLDIMALSISLLWIFVAILTISEPGERMSNQFEQFGVEFLRCEWNKLSIEMQRMYLIFLSDTQQPRNIRSYVGIVCTRETFKRIITKGFSYFMTLRNFRT